MSGGRRTIFLLCALVFLSACAPQVHRRPLEQAIQEGVAFLVNSQQPDGSWGTGTETRGTEIYSMVPGSHDAFRVGTTALCAMALAEVGEKPAHDRAVEYLIAHGEARRDDGKLIYNTWAHLYALEALAREMRANPDPRLAAAARWHLDRLVRYQTYLGGWNYYDFTAQTQSPAMGPTSFETAAGLVALWEARQAGLDVPQKLIDAGRRRLEETRLPGGAYLYGSDYRYIPRLPANKDRGSCGRAQPCNYALWLWGSPKVGPAETRGGLDLLIADHAFLDMGRKRPFPHESWYQTSGYYYYFDHYYASLALEKLGEPDRARYVGALREMLLPYQEPDGSWWDYAMWDYHKPYGTAFAVMTLLRCR